MSKKLNDELIGYPMNIFKAAEFASPFFSTPALKKIQEVNMWAGIIANTPVSEALSNPIFKKAMSIQRDFPLYLSNYRDFYNQLPPDNREEFISKSVNVYKEKLEELPPEKLEELISMAPESEEISDSLPDEPTSFTIFINQKININGFTITYGQLIFIITLLFDLLK